MKTYRLIGAGALAALAAGASPAFAHTDGGHTIGFVAGVSHPVGGLDHLLAMVSVGIWSALSGNGMARRLWIAPAAFVAAMLVGATAGYLGIPLPMVETGIALSVALLGLMILVQVELPLAIGVAIVALFALYHGHAHGAEATGAIAGYMAGFAIATATLHAAGIGLGLLMTRIRFALHSAGAAIAAAGAYLLAS